MSEKACVHTRAHAHTHIHAHTSVQCNSFLPLIFSLRQVAFSSLPFDATLSERFSVSISWRPMVTLQQISLTEAQHGIFSNQPKATNKAL